MPVEKNVHVPDDLLADMQTAAQREGKTPDELFEEAGRRYLLHLRLDSLSVYGGDRAKRLGLQESDVDRLITESRQSIKSTR
jgi:hypothetical protein